MTLVRKTSSKSFSRVSSIGLNFAIPALANRDVKMAELVLDPVKKTGTRLRIKNIRFDGRHPQLIRSRGERCRIAARNCNASAFGNEPPCRRKADPAISARDQSCLAFQ